MRLLFVTQVMDKNDSVLGAYHNWVKALANKIEKVMVICLYKGEHDLPDNVKVYSLGKENGKEHALVYALRFLKLVWNLRREYDSVLVHMNQEYILLAGTLWKVLGKRVYLWRNHYKGSFVTDIAAKFCNKVFCTSKHSYTAKFKKTVFMPVGVDLARFETSGTEERIPNSILFLSRISPSKRVDVFIEALGMLLTRGVQFSASVYGSAIAEDEAYYSKVKDRAELLGLGGCTTFHPGIPNMQAPGVFSSHEIFANCSPSGMFDKVLFEAAASGCVVIAQSKDWGQLVGQDSMFSGKAEDLAQRIEIILTETKHEKMSHIQKQKEVTKSNSLDTLVTALVTETS